MLYSHAHLSPNIKGCMNRSLKIPKVTHARFAHKGECLTWYQMCWVQSWIFLRLCRKPLTPILPLLPMLRVCEKLEYLIPDNEYLDWGLSSFTWQCIFFQSFGDVAVVLIFIIASGRFEPRCEARNSFIANSKENTISLPRKSFHQRTICTSVNFRSLWYCCDRCIAG